MSYTQLQMAHDLEDLPEVEMPEGYGLRVYRPGDEAAWADIMNTGLGEGWDASKARERLIGLPEFRPERLFFATCEGRPVGSTCAWKWRPEEPRMGMVHMVCVVPEHRGRGLGRPLVLVSLHYFRNHGYLAAVLTTDDFRLGAIKVYLSVGFRPVLVADDHHERWERCLEELGMAHLAGELLRDSGLGSAGG